MQVVIWAFVILPFLAVVLAVPATIQWGFGPSWLDITMAVTLYFVTCAGVGVGYHRYFTHGSFKAKRGLRTALAVAGSLAVEGNVIQWVADHRRHHRYTDIEGDPHSPWRFGTSVWALAKGLLYAHVGWLFDREFSNRERFARDLMTDSTIRRIDRLFPVMVVLSLGGPAVIGGLATWSWQGALSAFFWASLVRVAVLHHVTWSINSVCHVFGKQPFKTREGDKATNFWPLAILSLGESWHNLHHADPKLARHGALRRQVDINARLIWLFERFGWAYSVRWPNSQRLEGKRAA
jgi:stearoyl-CoA desaturase (delta-9 desaturase)